MLRSSKQVNPDIFRLSDVVLAVGRGMYQRGSPTAAAPVFDSRIGQEQFGYIRSGPRIVEQSFAHAAYGIALRRDREWKESRQGGAALDGRGPPGIQFETSRTCDMRHYRVKHLGAMFIGIKSFVQELTQEAATLGLPKSIGKLHRSH